MSPATRIRVFFIPLTCLWLLMQVTHRAAAQYAASPLTQLSMHSEQGDYIGQGRDYLYNANDGNFTPSVQTNSAGKAAYIRINFGQGSGGDDWSVSFSSQQLGTELTPGSYNQAERAPFADSGHPGLEISGNGRGSNTLTGKFTVTEAVYDYSTSPARLVSFAATFEQHSEGGSAALTGTIYYNSNSHPPVADTSHPNTTAALAGTIGKYGRYGGPVQVTLAATDPDGAADVAATYYTLDGGVQQTYVGPFFVSSDGMHSVRYHSADRAGNQEPSELRTVWIDTSPATTATAQTSLVMHSQPGDYIGGGHDYLYSDSDGLFSATAAANQSYGQTGVPVNTVAVSFHTPNYTHNWSLDFSTQQLGLPITVGAYENAMREAFTALGHPGLEVSGDGRGSNTLTGSFTLLDVVFDYSTSATQPNVVSFAATFEQHSEGAVPALTGTVYYRSTAYAGTPVMVTFSPSTITAGQAATGTVTLATPAPTGGEVVALSSSNSGVAAVPAAVTVPAGALSATFSVSTTAVGTQTSVDINAFANGVASIGTLIVQPFSSLWTAISVSAGADGFTRILWDNTSGQATVWKVNASGQLVTQQQFGPYSGWTAKAIATGNQTRLLWTNVSGQATVWTLDANNSVTTQQLYGPYSGWTAQAVAAEPDGTARLLWDNASGQATVWTLDGGNTLTTQQQYGPYSGWTAKSLAVNPDGTQRLLWINVSGQATFWKLSSSSQMLSQQLYGPYSGWTANSIAAAPDGTGRVVWVNSDAHITLWNLDAGNALTSQTQFGPYSGWAFQSLGVGSDGSARLLWDNVSGQAALWSVTPGGNLSVNTSFGPY